MKKITCLLILLLAVFACKREEIDTSGAQTVKTDPELSWSAKTFTAYLGVSNTLPTLKNEQGVSVKYSSSDEKVATIDAAKGTITLVAAGETLISADFEGNDSYLEDSATYSLTVRKSEGGLAWSAEEVNVVIGDESTYTYPTLTNPNGLKVSYASSNGSVATIDAAKGTITLIADGSTVITAAFASDGNFEDDSAAYTLNVTKNTDGISWSAGSCTVTIGADDNVFPTLNNPGEQTVSYSSSNTGVATIDASGAVTLVSAGEAAIIAKSMAKSTSTVDYQAITVSYALTVLAEGSNLVSAGLSWPETAYSTTTVSEFSSPVLDNPNGLSVSYASSDTGVATISSNGTVTIVGAGTTVITATSEATDTYLAGSAYYTLTVSLASPGLSWSEGSCAATLKSQNTYPTLTNESGVSVSYSSTNTGVATVDSQGAITLVGAGTTYIYATSEADGTYSAGSVYYTLKVSKCDVTLSWSTDSFTASIEESNTFPSLTITPADADIASALNFTSTNASVATVGASAQDISLVGTGTTTIKVSFAGNACYNDAFASYTLNVTSSADDGAITTVFDPAGDGTSSDDISNTTFTRLVTVNFSGDGATVSGCSAVADVMQVSQSGNEVTITYTGGENVVYKLTGTASEGFFKLYSSKKQALWLSNLNLTCSTGAAINNQSGKRTFVYVEGASSLTDGSSSTYTTTGSEDMKAVFFSEGQLVFSGSGSLKVTANNKQAKSCIASDDYVRLMNSPSLTLISGSSAGHGLRGKEYVQLSGGTLKVTTAASMKKGITSEDYVLVEGGNHTITVTGSYGYDSEDGEYKGTAGIKADNYFGMTGGTLSVTNSGTGGKGIHAGSYDYVSENGTALTDSYISGGTLTVKTTGNEYTSGDISSKAIKIGYKQKSGSSYLYGGNLNITGGSIQVTCSKSEGLETKGRLTISGGDTYVYSTGDDAINSQGELNITGGYVYGYSTANDGIDTNCDMKISGGVVYAITTKGSPEVALDANTEEGYKLYINSGATIIAYGGLERGYSASQSVYNMTGTAGSWNALYNGSAYIAAFKLPSGISTVAVSAPSLTKGYKGVSVGGTTYANDTLASSSISGGTEVTLSTYSGDSGGGPGGGGPGGGGRPGGGW